MLHNNMVVSEGEISWSLNICQTVSNECEIPPSVAELSGNKDTLESNVFQVKKDSET